MFCQLNPQPLKPQIITDSFRTLMLHMFSSSKLSKRPHINIKNCYHSHMQVTVTHALTIITAIQTITKVHILIPVITDARAIPSLKVL